MLNVDELNDDLILNLRQMGYEGTPEEMVEQFNSAQQDDIEYPSCSLDEEMAQDKWEEVMGGFDD